jgi:hypothetical protein
MQKKREKKVLYEYTTHDIISHVERERKSNSSKADRLPSVGFTFTLRFATSVTREANTKYVQKYVETVPGEDARLIPHKQ